LIAAVIQDDVKTLRELKYTMKEIIEMRFHDNMNILNLTIDQ